jgi:hypothetical protein
MAIKHYGPPHRVAKKLEKKRQKAAHRHTLRAHRRSRVRAQSKSRRSRGSQRPAPNHNGANHDRRGSTQRQNRRYR